MERVTTDLEILESEWARHDLIEAAKGAVMPTSVSYRGVSA